MKDYIEQALRTASPEGDQLLHCAIGMVTETIEMDCAPDVENYFEEIGDTMWYVAIGCNALGVTLEEAEQMGEESELSPVVIAGDFIDLLKKQIFYGKQPDRMTQVKLLGSMIGSLREDCVQSGRPLDDVMAENIAKLKRRYPDKFSAERAINR